MTREKDGGPTWQELGIVDKIVVGLILLMVVPGATIRHLYLRVTDQEDRLFSSGGYEHDHIDELWKRNRGGGGE